MHALKFILPAVLLSGCSMGGLMGPNGATGYHSAPDGCAVGCGYGGAYDAAPAQSFEQNYQYSAPQTPDHYSYGTSVAQHAEHSPYATSPAPYGQTGHAHSEPVNQSAQYYGQPGYGQAPQLRGPQRFGYKYGTLGVTSYDVDGDAYGLQGRVGYQSANIWGVEGEASVGIISDKETVGALEESIGVEHQLAGFGVARLPVSQRFSVHARGGYHKTKVFAGVDDGTVNLKTTASDDGFAYGAGAEYALTPRDSLRADYTRYDVTGGGFDSVSLGYARKF